MQRERVRVRARAQDNQKKFFASQLSRRRGVGQEFYNVSSLKAGGGVATVQQPLKGDLGVEDGIHRIESCCRESERTYEAERTKL